MDKTALSLKPGFLIYLAVLLLLLPLKWVVAWFTAAAVHEIFHYLALKLCKCRVYDITVGVNGALMNAEPLSAGKEALCSLAGPAGGLCLCLLAAYFPRLAICGCAQSLYNLIPIFPMDGGRVVRSMIFHWFTPRTAARVCDIIEISVLILLHILGFAAWLILRLGPLPALFAVLVTAKNRKIPCKGGADAVQ